MYLDGTRASHLAIFLPLSGHVVVIAKDRRGLLVFLKHRCVFNGRLRLILPIFVFGFDLLLSDGRNVFAKQPQAQGTDRWIQGTSLNPTEKRLYGPLCPLVDHEAEGHARFPYRNDEIVA